MKRLSIILIYLVFTFSITSLFAQQISIYGSLSNPVGGFGKNLGTDPHITRRNGFDVGGGAGFAVTGYGFGIEINYPIGFKGFTWNTGADLIMNSCDGTSLNQTFNDLLAEEEDVEFNYGSWLQVPVLTGIRYEVPLLNKVKAYGMLQAGISFLRAARRKADVSQETVDERIYNFSRAFGYGAGLGIVVLNKLDLGIRFLSFGEPMFDGEKILDDDYFSDVYNVLGKDVILGQRIPVSFLLIRLGYYLN